MRKRKIIQILIAMVLILGSVFFAAPVHAFQTPSEDHAHYEAQTIVSNEDQRPLQQQDLSSVVDWVLKATRKLVALILAGLLGVWLFPNFLNRSVAQFKERPWASAGIGALIFISFPIAILILIAVFILIVFLFNLATLSEIAVWTAFLGGAGIFSLVVLFGLIITYLLKIIAGLWLGRFILSRINQDFGERDWLCLIAGVFLITLLTTAPWIGWLLSLLIDLFGLGLLWLTVLTEKNPSS